MSGLSILKKIKLFILEEETISHGESTPPLDSLLYLPLANIYYNNILLLF